MDKWLEIARQIGPDEFHRLWTGVIQPIVGFNFVCMERSDANLYIGERIGLYYYCGNLEIVQRVLTWMWCAKHLHVCKDVARIIGRLLNSKNHMKQVDTLKNDNLFKSLFPPAHVNKVVDRIKPYTRVYDKIFSCIENGIEQYLVDIIWSEYCFLPQHLRRDWNFCISRWSLVFAQDK